MTRFKTRDAPGSQRPGKLRCIIIGAGVSGILIAQKLKDAFKDQVEFWIFEKNAEVGGTWLENRYPGCACDVPSHIYQFSFCPNPYWSSFYASSREINAYLKAVVFHYGLEQHISFDCAVDRATWDEETSLWTVSVEGQGNFVCEILFNAGGILNHTQFPRIDGLDRYQGQLLHTASWNEEIDLHGKRLAIIGAGASAIQLLPAIRNVASHVDIYIRTPSWISPPAFAASDGDKNHLYTSAEIQRFKDDKEFSVQTRKEMESSCNKLYRSFLKGGKEQSLFRKELEESMRRLIPNTQLQDKLIPKFEVGCRRINPGEPYLEALQQDNVEPVFDPISEVTPAGIIAGGTYRQADVIIAATGFDSTFRPRFPIIGRNGVNLQDLWQKDPVAYWGLAVSSFPNYLIFLGPNTPISNGSLMGSLEATADYFIRLIGKLMHEKAVSFEVRLDAQQDFDSHTQSVMKDMVWTGSCRSWYKSSTGKITALWPGSSLHYREILESNRWEDFQWNHSGNRFAYWRQGFSQIEQSVNENKDLAEYLHACEPLPLEAYYLAAKGVPGKAVVKSIFRTSRSDESRCPGTPDSDSVEDRPMR